MQAGRIRGLVVTVISRSKWRAGDSAPIQVDTGMARQQPNTANFVQGYVEGIRQSGNSSGRKIAATIFEPLTTRPDALLV